MTLQEIELRGSPFCGGGVDYTRGQAPIVDPADLAGHLGRHMKDYAHPELVVHLEGQGPAHFALTFTEISAWEGKWMVLTDLHQLEEFAQTTSLAPIAFLLQGDGGVLYSFSLTLIAPDTFSTPCKPL